MYLESHEFHWFRPGLSAHNNMAVGVGSARKVSNMLSVCVVAAHRRF